MDKEFAWMSELTDVPNVGGRERDGFVPLDDLVTLRDTSESEWKIDKTVSCWMGCFQGIEYRVTEC